VDGRGDGSRLGRMEQRALSSCARARRAACCWPVFGGIKQRARTREHGRVRVVLCARRGVLGDPTGPWPCRWHARITQRRRVGELEPKTVFLGVGGQFHELVKRTKNRRRASRAPSGGAPGRAHLVGNAQRARRRLAGLVRRVGSGRAKCT